MQWVCEVGRNVHLSTPTIHIAVAYLDYVLAKQDVAKGQFHLVGLTCLVLAAKYDELDRNIPSLSTFLRSAGPQLLGSRAEDVKDCEMLVLRVLEWNLCIFTPLIFVEMLLTQGVLNKSDMAGDTPVSCEIAKRVTKRALALADSALQRTFLAHLLVDYPLLQHCPSLIAVACVLGARTLCGVSPRWSKHLELVTTYDYEQVAPCYTLLLQYLPHLRPLDPAALPQSPPHRGRRCWS